MLPNISKYYLIIIIFFLFGCAASNNSENESPGHNDVIVSDLAVKSLKQYTTDGELWFSAKVTVKNNISSAKTIEIIIQGIDKDSFEIEDVYLEGYFNPNETKTLTNREFSPIDEFNKIIKWQIRKINYL